MSTAAAPGGARSMRRKFGIPTQRIAGGLLAVGLLAALHVPSANAQTEAGQGTGPGTAAARAQASYQALNKYFEVGQQGLLLEEYPNHQQNPYSYVWPYSQAAIAAENLAGIPGAGRKAAQEAERRLDAYELYWNDTTTP